MGILSAGEEVYFKTHKSRLTRIHWYLLSVALLVIAGLVGFNFFGLDPLFPVLYLSLALVVAGLVLIIYSEVKIQYYKYYVTNHRVIKQTGILKKIVDSCTYDKMVNVKLSQSLMGRLLKIGSVDIITFQKTEILLGSVFRPEKLVKKIYEMIEKVEGGRALPRPGPVPPGSKEPAEKEYPQ